MSTDTAPAHALAIDDLSIALPDGRRLFDHAGLTIEPGQFVLLVGPSGSGKSTLLRLVAGLDEPERIGLRVAGTIDIGAEPGAAAPRVGLVFQNHALFDELTALGNVQFAVDHRPSESASGDHIAEDLLRSLHVEPSARPATLSGGERQRVAVARTMAMDPPLILFDEPTTGLDPARARSVADLIHETHERTDKTTVVVTHDFGPFLKHAPRLVLLDAATGKLRDVDEAELRARLVEHDTSADAVHAPKDTVLKAPPRWLAWIEAPGEVVLTLLQLIAAVIGGWRRPAWKLRYLWYYGRMAVVGTSAIYVAISGIMLGFVLVSFSFAQLPYTEVTVPLLTEEFLAATGYSTFRVIVPLLIAVLVAGKCGASIAADVGTRRYAHQFDAMRNCGATPEHYLYGNIAVALIVGVPILTAIAYFTNCYASLVAFLMTSPEGTVALFFRNYFATSWPDGQWLPSGSGWVVLKMATSGYVIAALSYAIGSRPKTSPVDVSRDVGLTIFWTSLAVLLLHSLYSFVEF